MNNPPITISTMISAPITTVWECWTNPEHITKWNQASDDWHSPSATNDLRVGGKFTTRMEAKDGSAGFDFGGTYDEVIPKQIIAYTMDDGRKVRVEFTNQAEQQTQITETFDPEETNSLEMQRDGWQAILDNFKRYTEQLV